MSGRRKKVAVLGGGAGGITAAFELTRNGEFDVTVYQLGWRLGGKGASGRNASIGSRIEEHGLHVWFGFYANAFALMTDAYQELHRPSSVPIATIDQAFRRCNQMVLYDYVGGDWFAHAVDFPTNGPDPWRGTRRLPTFWGVAHTAVRRARAAIAALGPARGTAPADAELVQAENLASNGLRSLHAPIPNVSLKRFVRKLQNACRKLAAAWASELANPAAHPALRLVFTTIDAFTAMAVGILEDELLVKGFSAVDGWDWADWMKHHGASSITIPPDFRERAPAVRSVYDVAFCFPDGDVDKASAAAGTATSNLLRLQFAYRGAIAYKMSAGMGDVVFAPLYEVLHRRKVKFRFFHAVTHLGVSPDGQRVDRIDVVPQVDLRGVGEYDPLVEVNSLPCWPNEPLWDQLEDGATAKGASFETELNPLSRDCETLRLGHDFDYVVLAIPPCALRSIGGDLMDVDARFRTMVEGSRSVATQAFQLWTLESQRSLGFAHSPDSIVSSYVEPLDTFCDMDHLLHAEAWPPTAGVKGVAYACGVLDDRPGETPAQATQRVRNSAEAYLNADIRRLWPNAVTRVSGSPFRWDVLADLRHRTKAARFDGQYWRANVAPWERYVITPAGSVDKRLPAGDSGFENLVLAGDWTSTSINGGCVEAAVMSGMQAARAITKNTKSIVGESFKWLTP